MARINITDRICYNPEETGYMMLDITGEIKPLPAQVIENIYFTPKNEYHCSLLAPHRLTGNVLLQEKIFQDTVNFLQQYPEAIQFSELKDSYFLCRKDKRATVIELVRIEGIDEIARIVQQYLPHYISPQLHVTLLKSESTEYGIRLNSAEDMQRYCTKIPGDGLKRS